MKIKSPYIVFVLIISLFWLCTDSEYKFDQVACEVSEKEQNLIYQPCRQFIFQAQYWDKNQELISDQKIRMVNIGKVWTYDSTQSTLLIQYEFDKNEKERIESYNINPSRTIDWTNKEETGFIEDKNNLWLHPFRANQYYFTEIAPFPNIRYTDLILGNKWTSRLNIHDGWGIWSNTQVQHYYEVVDIASVNIPFQDLKNCTHIKSEAISEFGSSTLDYWFHPEFGIVRYLYRNHEGQTCNIELINVIDP